jgi:hypothetical protein
VRRDGDDGEDRDQDEEADDRGGSDLVSLEQLRQAVRPGVSRGFHRQPGEVLPKVVGQLARSAIAFVRFLAKGLENDVFQVAAELAPMFSRCDHAGTVRKVLANGTLDGVPRGTAEGVRVVSGEQRVEQHAQ